MKQALWGCACIAVSVGAHAAALLRTAGSSEARLSPAFVELMLTPAAPQPAAPEPRPLAPDPKPTPRARAPQRALLPVPAPTAVAPEPPEPSGQTLLAGPEASWTAPEGTGSVREGAFGASLSAAARPAPAVAAPPERTLPATQPLAQLSRRPAPPALESALQRNYPPRARRQGQSGEATVRALIEASGRVSNARTTFETADGFGAACRKTLLESRWSAPLGRSGQATATFITYRCRFQVAD